MLFKEKMSTFCWRGCIYLIKKEKEVRLGISHNPGLDRAFWLKRGYRHFRILTPPLPLGTVAFLLERLRQRVNFKGRDLLKEVEKVLTREAQKIGLVYRPVVATISIEPVSMPAGAELALLKKIMAGRILWLEEVGQALLENKTEITASLSDLLHCLYLQGKIIIQPGVGYDSDGQPRCRRCGQGTRILKVDCHTCKTDDCLICEGCLTMGLARRCRPLYAAGVSAASQVSDACHGKYAPRLEFQLTPAQADAYQEAAAFVDQSRERQCLLWAACGAGKTEVAYGAIASALAQGKNILYTCPRREVIKELYPRFVAAWPQVNVQALYGGSVGKYARANLYLATTHQALRFYRKFDLVILDEVDAYPLAGEPMLYYAVQRACREKGQTLWLTATPPAKIKKQVRCGRAAVIFIPARHHGRPLPLPQIIRIPGLKWPTKGKLPRQLQAVIKKILEQRIQLLLFVPTVNLVDRVVAELDGNWDGPVPGDVWVRGCYASHPQKEETIAAFYRGEFPVLVSTTVMERGVTIPRVAVLVLHADREIIFSGNTLVQIAGRVGRSEEYPDGDVWFTARRVSPAMAEALNQIKSFNRLARRKGYLFNK